VTDNGTLPALRRHATLDEFPLDTDPKNRDHCAKKRAWGKKSVAVHLLAMIYSRDICVFRL
jgi:hypothetical protein